VNDSEPSAQAEQMERMQARFRGDPPLLCPAGFPVPPGTKEWVVAQGPRGDKGPKGDKGDQGEKGASRLPVVQARAVVYLFVLNFALFLVLGAALFHYVHAYQSGQARDQAAQRKAGQVIEHALCATFGELALNKPPAGNPATNPSRAYDQRQSAILGQVGPDLRCPAR
jgi:hypothetical protein